MFVSPCSTLRHGRVATPGFIRLSDTGCRRFRRIFGGGDERLIGRRFFFFFFPEYLGSPRFFSFRGWEMDASRGWMRFFFAGIFLPCGRILYFVYIKYEIK